MIDVVYGSGSFLTSILPIVLFFLMFVVFIFGYSFWMGKAEKNINLKSLGIIKTVVPILIFGSLFFAPDFLGNLFTSSEKGLTSSQYETFLSKGSSTLQIRSKDPNLKSEKMFFRIKKGSSTLYVKPLNAISLDEENLKIYANFSSLKRTTYGERELVVSKKSLNFRNK